MAIMTCPRCGGSDAILEGELDTTAGLQKRVCPSCSGKGYVADEQIKYPDTNSSSEVKINWITPIVTRDTDRIDRILDSIRAIWCRFPDWRLGQLLANAVPDLERNIFYIEDTVAEEKLDAFEGKMDEALDRFLKT
jgi:hypothetical protein